MKGVWLSTESIFDSVTLGAAKGLGWRGHRTAADPLPRFPDYVEDSRQSRSFGLRASESFRLVGASITARENGRLVSLRA